MEKIYVIFLYNGEIYEDAENIVWAFAETEEEAKNVVDKLNNQLKNDIKRCEYLNVNHMNLDSNDKKECEILENKYPGCNMFWCCEDPNFFYTEVEKARVE